jgi:hypothetical protein
MAEVDIDAVLSAMPDLVHEEVERGEAGETVSRFARPDRAAPRLPHRARRSVAALLLGAALLAAGPADVAGSGVNEGLPAAAVAVLERFVGDWETETFIRYPGPPARESRTLGRGSGRRMLQGRYVEFRTASVPPGQSDLQIMTYDVGRGRFRQWVFDADGYRHEAEGEWDPATSTLTWRGQIDGAVFVIADRWVSPDRLEWTLTRTAADGRRVQAIHGALTRAR